MTAILVLVSDAVLAEIKAGTAQLPEGFRLRRELTEPLPEQPPGFTLCKFLDDNAPEDLWDKLVCPVFAAEYDPAGNVVRTYITHYDDGLGYRAMHTQPINPPPAPPGGEWVQGSSGPGWMARGPSGFADADEQDAGCPAALLAELIDTTTGERHPMKLACEEDNEPGHQHSATFVWSE